MCHLTRKVTLYARAFVLLVIAFYICIFAAHFFLVFSQLTAYVMLSVIHAAQRNGSYRAPKLLTSTLLMAYTRIMD